MKYKKMALVMALGVGLSACNNQQPAENNTQTEVIDETNNEKVDKKVEDTNQNMESVSVYASFFPIYNLTKQIAGDKFDVKSFTNLKTESHGWEPSAKDIAELSNSQVMFINGAGMEELEESLESSSDIELVNTTKDVELIKGSHNHDHEYDDEYYNHENNYGHHHHDYEDDYEHHHHDHENDNGYHHHDYEDNHEHHQHGEFDPHTWLSPKNGIAQAKVIAEKLSEIDPANRDYYMDNYKKIEEELNAMIDEYTEKFASIDNKNFLVSHQAFGYLANDFGLNQIALTSLGATEDADAKTLKNAIIKAKDLGIDTVFYEMGGSDKSAKTIADEIDATTVPLNTLEFATDEELNNGTSYQDMIKYNLEELYKSMEK
ncbi:metal ABC transporter solute-binding protein, Zn/Mn family [Anaerococcus cruorum]|uniref:metal ABC transporter solute-binding protein, Zn/Mn family n=1 Tax=Anaerococcus sp. WGS1596 TaxID=3366806 RepID=UPI00372D7DD6